MLLSLTAEDVVSVALVSLVLSLVAYSVVIVPSVEPTIQCKISVCH